MKIKLFMASKKYQFLEIQSNANSDMRIFDEAILYFKKEQNEGLKLFFFIDFFMLEKIGFKINYVLWETGMKSGGGSFHLSTKFDTL